MTQDSAPSIDIGAQEKNIIRGLLRRHLPDVAVWAYGSRVQWNARAQSDLDLVAFAPAEQKREVLQLREAFEESTLPFSVDLLIWDELPESFHKNIKAEYVVLQTAKEGHVNNTWRDVPFLQLLSEPVRNGIYKKKEFHGMGTKIVNMGELFEHSRLPNVPMKRVELSDSEQQRFSIKAGDLLFARRSLVAEGAGKCSVVLEICEPTTFESSIIRARPDHDKADSLFLYYYFSSPSGLHSLDTIRRHVAVAGITGTDLAQLPIMLPPLQEQRAIAHVLGTLDDKIELNRRMNQTLEEMAQAIFKDWFVDFGPVRAKIQGREPYLSPDLWELFPDRLVDSELGDIPEGWTITTLGEIATVGGGSTPSTKASEYWDGGTHCWATPKDLSRLATSVLLETERKITDAGLKRIGSGLLPKGSVLLSSRAPIGYLAINEVPVAVNQGLITLVPREQVGNMFLLNWCYAFFDEIISRANGSTFLEISKGNFRTIMTALPPKPIMDHYQTSVVRIYERVVRNERETRVITEKRNLILPKLISGELRVGDKA